MPELPEVERAVGVLRQAIAGAVIAQVRLLHPALRRRVTPRVLRSLRGARVARVERRGKHQLVHLDDGRILHVHFRMNGDWVVDRDAEALPRFARAAITFENGMRVVLEDSRMLSTLDVHAASAPPDLGLGPEPQDPALTAAALRSALAPRRIALKVALLDQGIIAGLGNIYAAESLWRARLDPRLPANALDLPGARRLLSAMRHVLERASGSRYSDDDVTELDVYDRSGLPCRRCGTAIERITQAGRSTWFCPRCQRRPASRVSRAPRGSRS